MKNKMLILFLVSFSSICLSMDLTKVLTIPCNLQPQAKTITIVEKDGTINIYNQETYEFIRRIVPQSNVVQKIEYSTDGKTLTATSNNIDHVYYDVQADELIDTTHIDDEE